MSKYSRKNGKLVKTWVEFSWKLFNDVRTRNYVALGKERLALKKELKKYTLRTVKVRGIESRLEEIEQLYALQKELTRQFSSSWYVVVDGNLRHFSKKTEAREAAGLEPFEDEGTVFVDETRRGGTGRLVEKGTTVKTATPEAKRLASSIGSDGALFRICPRCEKEKPYTDFNFHASAACGRQSRCRDCSSDESKKYYIRKAKMVDE